MSLLFLFKFFIKNNFFLAMPQGLRDLNSPTRIEPGSPAVEVRSPNHWIAREFPIFFLRMTCRGFPGGAVVKTPPAQCRGHGFEPWSRKIPHSSQQLSHNCWACALEPGSHNYWAHVPQLLKPTRLEPVLRNKRSHCSEKPALQWKVAPAPCK